jgi:ankyrin repeat protein
LAHTDLGFAMTDENHELDAIREMLSRLLKDLTRPNGVRIKAGLQILMTATLPHFETIVSKNIQEELSDFKALLEHPETIAPLACTAEPGKTSVIQYIKTFVVNNLFLLDGRTSILPNVDTVARSVMGGERLKSVVHTSALRNVTTAANFVDILEKKFKSEGYTGDALDTLIQNATLNMTQLQTAVLEGNLERVKKKLETQTLDINLPSPDGLSLLHVATCQGHTKIVELLAAIPGVNANLVNNNGWTALHFAARLGLADIVKILIKIPGIQINLVNSDGWTPLHWAAWHGHTSVITALMSSEGLNVNPHDSSQCTPLHWAARNGHADVIAILLSIPGIEANGLDIESKTPLHYAINYDHISAVSSLLTAPRLNINIQDINGLTPLHWAARGGQLEMVNLLLSIPGIRMDLLDLNNMDPADWAKRNRHNELVPLLDYGRRGRIMSSLIEIGASIKSFFSSRFSAR